MEPLALNRDGFAWNLSADVTQLTLTATAALERFVLRMSATEVPTVTGNKLRTIDECYRLIKSALLARAGTLFIQPSVSRTGNALVFHVKGSMVPMGQCDFAMHGETGPQSVAAAPVVALPGSRPVQPQQVPSQSSFMPSAPENLANQPQQQDSQDSYAPMSLLAGMSAARKPQPTTQNQPPNVASVMMQNQAAARPASPLRARGDALNSSSSSSSSNLMNVPAVRMSTPAVSATQLLDTKVKRRTVMTLYRQLRDQLEEAGGEGIDRMPKFHGDMPSTLNMIASGIRSRSKSLTIAGRPFRGRSSAELLALARQLESKPLSSASLRPLPSKVHLMIDLKSLSITMPFGTEEVELSWNIYTTTATETPLYDPIRMILGPDGKPIPGSRSSKLIFSNLPVPVSEIVVVCKVHRFGWFDTSQVDSVASKRESLIKDKIAVCRRPVGSSVLELAPLSDQILAEGAENVQTMWIYTAHDENLSWGLHSLLARKIKQGYEDMKLLPASKGVLIGISLLSDTQLRAQLDSGVPASQTRQIPLGFKETQRNDLYITLSEANFPSKTPTSIQITARVTQNDQTLAVISRGVLSPIDSRNEDSSQFSSFVIQDSNHPRWEETFCVKLPHDITAETTQKGPIVLHVSAERIEAKKVKEFAHGQIVLADSMMGVALDGSHEVVCAAAKAQGLKKMTDRALQKEERSGHVTIRTSLSSTHVVRNQHLSRLFQWRIMSPGEILEMLNRLPSAHEELIGFLPETLDTLNTLLDVVDDDQVSVAVLAVLSFVIDQVCDERRSKDVRSLLNTYVDGPRCTITKRGAARLHRAMAVFFGTYRTRPAHETSHIVGSLDVLHRLLTRGRSSNSPVPTNIVDDPRQFSLQIASGFKGLMMEQDPVFFAPQVVAIVKLETLLSHFRQFMTAVEVASVVVSVLSVVPIQSTWNTTITLDESATPAMIARVVNEHLRSIEKLEFIERLVARGNDGLLADPESRAVLWPALLEITLKHLIPLTDKSTEVEEDALHYTSSVLQRMISLVQKGSSWEYLRPSLLPILPALFDLWQSVQQFTDSVILICDVAIVILALLYVTTATEFTNYVVKEISEHAQQQALLTSLCRCLSSMITRRRSGTPFPSDWTEFIALQLRSTHLTVVSVAAMVSSNPLTLATCKPVISQYLQLLFAFVNSPHVRVDGQMQLQLSTKKSTAQMAEELMTLVTPTWKGLNPDDQVDVAEDIIGPVLKASLIFNPASIGQRAGALFQAMLQRCVSQTGQEVRIRTRIVRTIIQDFALFFVPRSRGRPKEFVTGWIQKLITEPPPDQAIAEVPMQIKQRLIDDVTVLVSVVSEIESLPHDKWLDLRIARTHFLLDHLKQLGETYDYIRILQVLYELHRKAGNLAQAGYALQLNIDLLTFDENKMEDALHDLPRQTSAERKVELMHRAIDLFSRAKLYEEAIELCGALSAYLRRRYRLKELADVLSTESSLVKGALAPASSTTGRISPQYWYFSFSGDKLPEWVRDKEFVSVSYNREQASDVYQRLRVEWPDSRVVNVFLSRQELIAQQQQSGNLIQAVALQPLLNDAVLLNRCGQAASEAPETLKSWIQAIYPNKFVANVRPEPTQEFEHKISVLNHFPSLLSLVPVDVHAISGPRFVPNASLGPRTASPPPLSTSPTPQQSSAPPTIAGARNIPIAQAPVVGYSPPQQNISPPSSASSSSGSSPSSVSSNSLASSTGSLASSSGSTFSVGSTGSITSSSSPPPQPQYPASPLLFSVGSGAESPPPATIMATGQPQLMPMNVPSSSAKLPPVSAVLPAETQRAQPTLPVLNPSYRPQATTPEPRPASPGPAARQQPANVSPVVVPVTNRPLPTALPSRIQVKLDGPPRTGPTTPTGTPVEPTWQPQQPQMPSQPQVQPTPSSPVALGRPMLPGMAPATPLQLRTMQQPPPQ